ncbi:MAG: tRNA uridine-5-carboxymethylaminomethyl(34) synthesis GTPase MnmE [Candidatus Omnitrophica bacterium]|nr:tRNA uridine-5-carboxymethylaminomethyl(34) synthesis GTPase MnmE [Candidatus Omnitrophota bacterium]
MSRKKRVNPGSFHMNVNTNDTIAAVSTPAGEGGIGIVRLSGSRAVELSDILFRSVRGKALSTSPTHTLHYGHIVHENEVLDEVMVALMRAPRSYTAEDTVEINCHGGSMPLKSVLEACLSAGARLAEPGEFTRRAFINGRIDLSQAEAVLDMIRAETDVSRRTAVKQLEGELSERIRQARHSLVNVLALVELRIDFSQEDVEFSGFGRMISRLEETLSVLRELLKTADKGMMLRKGASLVICGRPNVGKSSLMNALLRHDRVIVTPIAGTTRDVIEEHINIGGVKVRVTDTAGIIETTDRVELEGIKRSRQKLEQADVALVVLDASSGFSPRDREIFDAVTRGDKIVVANKSDLESKIDTAQVREQLGVDEIIKVSALKKEGLDALEDTIAERLFGGEATFSDDIILTNTRHKDALQKASEHIVRALETARRDMNEELVAADLREAAHNLALVTGSAIEEDILDRIFSEFCIGK